MATPQSSFPTAVDPDTSDVRSYLSGDDGAFTRIMNRHRRTVFSVAYQFTQHAQEAEDLAQDVFVKVFQNLKTFRGDCSFRTWIMRIATNRCINWQKSSRVSKDSGQEPKEDAQWFGTVSEVGLDECGQRRLLRLAISKLPPKQRTALLLKTIGDMTCEEVAETMKCSPGTVKAHVFSAMGKLRRFVLGRTP